MRLFYVKSNLPSLVKRLPLIAIVFIIAGLCYGGWRWWKSPLYSSFLRGKVLAGKLGCFGCHGPEGIRGIPNPGSEEKNVPSWDGGTLMMYTKNEGEIREWILDGMPKRIRDNPDEAEELSKVLIRMPAYRNQLSQKELEDLVAYFKAVAWARAIPDPLASHGREVALEKGCFGCHGPEGRSPTSNPGSLKGYIPPWDSRDFNDLVRDDKELEEWILKGITKRFEENKFARFFLERQKISMPPYKKHITKEELEALKAYIKWVRKNN